MKEENPTENAALPIIVAALGPGLDAQALVGAESSLSDSLKRLFGEVSFRLEDEPANQLTPSGSTYRLFPDLLVLAGEGESAKESTLREVAQAQIEELPVVDTIGRRLRPEMEVAPVDRTTLWKRIRARWATVHDHAERLRERFALFLRLVRYRGLGALGKGRDWDRLVLSEPPLLALARFSRWEARLGEDPELRGDESEMRSSLESHAPGLLGLFDRQVRLDREAVRCKERRLAWLTKTQCLALALFALVAVQAMGLVESEAGVRVIRWAIVGGLALGALVAATAKLFDHDGRALSFRGAAELLRLEIVLRLVGIRRPMANDQVRRLLGDDRWLMRVADAGQGAPTCAGTREQLEWAKVHWVQGQLSYHRSAAGREQVAAATHGLFAKVAVFAAVLAIAWAQLAAQPPAHLIPLGAALLFSAALLEQRASVFVPDEQVQRFRTYYRLFATRASRFAELLPTLPAPAQAGDNSDAALTDGATEPVAVDEANLDKARKELRALGGLALVEHAFWLAGQRARGIQMARPQ